MTLVSILECAGDKCLPGTMIVTCPPFFLEKELHLQSIGQAARAVAVRNFQVETVVDPPR